MNFPIKVVTAWNKSVKVSANAERYFEYYCNYMGKLWILKKMTNLAIPVAYHPTKFHTVFSSHFIITLLLTMINSKPLLLHILPNHLYQTFLRLIIKLNYLCTISKVPSTLYHSLSESKPCHLHHKLFHPHPYSNWSYINETHPCFTLPLLLNYILSTPLSIHIFLILFRNIPSTPNIIKICYRAPLLILPYTS